MTDIIDPENCQSMAEVRAGVDAIDRQVVALLKRRFGYMDAAARIKPDREAVRDESRTNWRAGTLHADNWVGRALLRLLVRGP